VVAAAADAYQQAGVTNPRAELAMAEVHDCFTPTELVLMEDLGFAERGMAWKEVLAGTFDLDGELPVNPDGGLKAFGHPIGASGLRMLFECWLQLRGEAGERQIKTVAEGKRSHSPTTWRPAGRGGLRRMPSERTRQARSCAAVCVRMRGAHGARTLISRTGGVVLLRTMSASSS
jgi:hypothetical protein